MTTRLDALTAQGVAELLRQLEDLDGEADAELWSKFYDKGLDLFAADGTDRELDRASDYADRALARYRKRFPRALPGELAEQLAVEGRLREAEDDDFARAEDTQAPTSPVALTVTPPESSPHMGACSGPCSRHYFSLGRCIHCGALEMMLRPAPAQQQPTP